MSNDKESGGFGIQVLAGALAAATAALLGSTLGVAGTVLGAAVASVVTTIAAAIYLHSWRRTRQGVRLVQEKVAGRWTGTIPKQPDGEPATEPDDAARPTTGRRTWIAVAAASAVAFALGILVITGLEMVRGEPLSGGQGGTTIGELVRPAPGPAQRPDQTPPPTTTTPTRPGGTSSVPPQPPTTTAPPTTTPPPTTTAPPTTTKAPPPSSAAPPPSEVG